jgi:hypothetical protein
MTRSLKEKRKSTSKQHKAISKCAGRLDLRSGGGSVEEAEPVVKTKKKRICQQLAPGGLCPVVDSSGELNPKCLG